MPAVFVHGVPDTYRVWNPVFALLDRPDVTALALPGFDSPIPDKFTATKEEYVDWIIARLEEQGEPVDLVGHDWGCIFVARVASLRPDLVRTWAAGDGPVSSDYEWHELAKILQTPKAGEEFLAKLDPEEFGKQLEQLGVPPGSGDETAARMDERMKSCILRLYRSARDVGSEWQPGLADIKSPGLIIWGAFDYSCPVAFADQLGRDAKARRVLKLETAHWFQLQAPRETADALQEHWNGAGRL